MIISTQTNRHLVSVRAFRMLTIDRSYTEQGYTISRSIVRTRTISVRTIPNEQVIAPVRRGSRAA
jgi:hypothetical protein